MSDEAKFESYLQKARVQKGYTQAELAKAANVSEVTIRNIEKGISVPNVLLAMIIGGLVGWAISDLFKSKGGTGDEE